jgi:hypothetical protein
LLDKIIQKGRSFASASDMQISDMGANTPVGTTLAILERTLKVMSAVQARIHYSFKQELKLLKRIIADYTPEEYSYEPVEGSYRAKKSDYDDVDVIPVSDPNASTMAQKIVQYQAALQLAQTAPQLYNLPLLHREMLTVLGIKNAAKLVPLEEDKKPEDPVTENQNLLTMKPVKAFVSQDHAAHIATHMAMGQDPHIQQLLQNNPNAQAIMAALSAHVAEHLGMQYRVQIEQRLGMALPPQLNDSGDPNYMNPEVEAKLAPMLAQAAQQLLAQSQAAAQQAQAQQQAQDPLIQMQQQELQIKAQEQQRKMQKDQVDAQLKVSQQEIERERIAAQAFSDSQRTAVQAAQNKEQMVAEMQKQNKELFTRGLDNAFKHANAGQQKQQQNQPKKEKPTKGD